MNVNLRVCTLSSLSWRMRWKNKLQALCKTTMMKRSFLCKNCCLPDDIYHEWGACLGVLPHPESECSQCFKRLNDFSCLRKQVKLFCATLSSEFLRAIKLQVLHSERELYPQNFEVCRLNKSPFICITSTT